MNRPRLSIASAIGGITVLGLGLAALKGASPFWCLPTTLATLGALLSSILGAILRRGRHRAFWLGFAVFGWTFLMLRFSAVPGKYLAIDMTGDFLSLRDDSTEISSGLGKVFHPNQPQRVQFGPSMFGQPTDQFRRFHQIFSMELNLLFALVGGFVVRSLATRAEISAMDDNHREPRRES